MKISLSRRLFGSLTAAALLLPMPAMAEPIQVTDVLGRTVELPDQPERILLGFYFEDTFAVGGPDVYDRVVGISREAWEGWRNLQWEAYVEAVPRIAEIADVGEVDAGSFSLEAAIATQPDVAIFAAWQHGVLGEAIDRMEDAGIPVEILDFNAQEVDKHVASTLALGAILGEEERAKELADAYAAAYADTIARVAASDSKPRVYVELGRKGAEETDNSYSGTMWGKLVDSAGGENIANGQIERWGALSPEYVLAQNPEVVFLAGSGWLSRDKAVILGPGVDASLTHERMQPYTDRPGWDQVAAIESGEVHGLYHGGARTLYDFAFFQYIAKQLHPEQFEDVDPQANLDAFFADYMPVKFSGTYMTQLP